MRAMTPEEAQRLAQVVRSSLHQWWACEVRRATLTAHSAWVARPGDDAELLALCQESTVAADAWRAALAALERAAGS